jgi:hypothetical protein
MHDQVYANPSPDLVVPEHSGAPQVSTVEGRNGSVVTLLHRSEVPDD